MKNRLSLLLAGGLLAFASLAPATEYSAWQAGSGAAAGDLSQLVKDLNVLIDKADRERAADRRFLRDLRDLVARYDWPWTTALLQEDFTNGRMDAASPGWQLVSGDQHVERGIGLYSKVRAGTHSPAASNTGKDDIAGALLGALLDQALKTEPSPAAAPTSTPGTPAVAYLSRRISNAFAVDLELDARAQDGRMNIELYQGRPGGAGYRLSFLPGPRASLELYRVGSRGAATIDATTSLDAPGDQVHSLQWTRDRSGNMKVSLNGTAVLSTIDVSLRDAFDGLQLANQEGEFAVRSVKVSGIP